MSKRSLLTTVLVLTASLLSSTTPVLAQADPGVPTTSTTIVEGAETSTTETTVPEQIGRIPDPDYVDPLIDEGGSTVVNEEGEPVLQNPDAEGSQTCETSEPVEGTETTQPAEGCQDSQRYGGQPQYQPPQILGEKVAEARVKFNDASEDFTLAVDFIRSLRKDMKVIDVQIARLDQRSAGLLEIAEGIRSSVETRAVTDFMIYQQGEVASPLGSEATIAEQMEKYSMDQLLKIDSDEIDTYRAIRDEIAIEVILLENEQKELSRMMLTAEGVVNEYRIVKDQAQIELEAFEAGSSVFVSGVVFPISGNVSLPLIDSYGFPRMPGTADAHWHEGIDIFAPKGTPLVATESGTISRLGSGRLGGLKFWLDGDSGVEWYYAHLHAFAPGLANGQKVEAGDLLGYVGDTGNAVGTPPHLHMQMHPDGGRPINPYPLLAMVVRTEQLNKINAFDPDPLYEPLSISNSQTQPASALSTAEVPSDSGSSESDAEQ